MISQSVRTSLCDVACVISPSPHSGQACTELCRFVMSSSLHLPPLTSVPGNMPSLFMDEQKVIMPVAELRKGSQEAAGHSISDNVQRCFDNE